MQLLPVLIQKVRNSYVSVSTKLPVWKGCPVHAVDIFCKQLDHAKNIALHAISRLMPISISNVHAKILYTMRHIMIKYDMDYLQNLCYKTPIENMTFPSP